VRRRAGGGGRQQAAAAGRDRHPDRRHHAEQPRRTEARRDRRRGGLDRGRRVPPRTSRLIRDPHIHPGGHRPHRQTTPAAPPPRAAASRPPSPQTMVQLLARRWSPEQISYELRHRFPGQPERHLVPETIYQAIYVQGRGGLRRELHRALRTGRALRRPRRGTTAPTGCCASTFPRAPTCRYTPPPISPPSRLNLTHDPALNWSTHDRRPRPTPAPPGWPAAPLNRGSP